MTMEELEADVTALDEFLKDYSNVEAIWHDGITGGQGFHSLRCNLCDSELRIVHQSIRAARLNFDGLFYEGMMTDVDTSEDIRCNCADKKYVTTAYIQPY